jgi:hypothetical protein
MLFGLGRFPGAGSSRQKVPIYLLVFLRLAGFCL